VSHLSRVTGVRPFGAQPAIDPDIVDRPSHPTISRIYFPYPDSRLKFSAWICMCYSTGARLVARIAPGVKTSSNRVMDAVVAVL
jgi:hypothetical protein